MVFFVFTTFLFAVSASVVTFLYFRLKAQEKKNNGKLNEKIIECELLKKDIENLEKEKENLQNLKKEYEQNVDNQLKKYEENFQKLLENSQKTMKESFENLSNSTLETQIKKFDENQNKQTQQLFKDCKEALDKVNGETQATINTNIRNMLEKANEIKNKAEEVGVKADNLADAFRGNKKIQGNWAERQLQETLEMFQMKEQENFDTQYRYNYKGQIYEPDFVIKIPQHKKNGEKIICKMIIDSKFSFVNYERYLQAETDDDKAKYIKEYRKNICEHIDELKKYRDTFNLYLKEENKYEGFDFVCMYFPLEQQYIEAIKYDSYNDTRKYGPNIQQYAFDNKVVLLTASSCVPLLRMIFQLWNIETQNKQINDIVEQVALLYDKLVNFYKNTNDTHIFLEKALLSHTEATKYLGEGNNNVIKTAREIRKMMGTKISNTLSNKVSADTKLFIEENYDNNDTPTDDKDG